MDTRYWESFFRTWRVERNVPACIVREENHLVSCGPSVVSRANSDTDNMNFLYGLSQSNHKDVRVRDGIQNEGGFEAFLTPGLPYSLSRTEIELLKR
jgi:hypothetical protein